MRSNLNFFNKHYHHDSSSGIVILPPISLIAFLFAGLSAAILIPASFPTIAYSVTNPVANTTNTDSTGQSPGLHPKEISDKVKEFMLNDIVNKSKVAIVIRFVDQDGTWMYSFGIYQKITTFRLMGAPFSI